MKSKRKLSSEEFKELYYKMKNGDGKAREELILSNLSLVHVVANRFCGTNIDRDDLVSESISALIDAIDKYDISLGNCFSTYACTAIKNQLERYSSEQNNIISYPSYIASEARRLLFVRNEITTNTGAYPTDEQLSIATGFTLKKIKLIKDYLGEYKSLNEEAYGSEDSDVYVIDTIASDDKELDEDYNTSFLKKEIKSALDMTILTDKEKDVINKLFGINGRKYKAVELAELYSLSRQRIDQICNAALRKLRRNSHIRNLSSYLGYDEEGAKRALRKKVN